MSDGYPLNFTRSPWASATGGRTWFQPLSIKVCRRPGSFVGVWWTTVPTATILVRTLVLKEPRDEFINEEPAQKAPFESSFALLVWEFQASKKVTDGLSEKARSISSNCFSLRVGILRVMLDFIWSRFQFQLRSVISVGLFSTVKSFKSPKEEESMDFLMFELMKMS